MAHSASADRHPHVARLRIGSILAGAVRLYRLQPARVAGASLAVLLPLVLVGQGIHALEKALHVSPDQPFLVAALLPSASALLALLGLVVLGGVMDELVGATIRGESPPRLSVAARELPWRGLIAADLAVTVVVSVGAALGVVPGLLVASLVAIVGPIVNIERLGPINAVRRSVRLTWPHAWLVMAVIVPSILVEGAVHGFLLQVWDRLGLVGELLVEVPIIVTIGAFIVLAEVVLAYALLARDPGSPVERMVHQAVTSMSVRHDEG